MLYVKNETIMSNILADATYACAHWCIEISPSCSYNLLVGNCVEDKWMDCLQKGGSLKVMDDEGKCHYIMKKDLSRAITLIRSWPRYKDENNWDGEFADAIIQTAVYGEVVFG